MRLKSLQLNLRRAFTLIEMMVVVVLIGILAAAIIPEMKGSFDDALLRATGRDLVDAFNLASSRAVGFGRRCCVKFDTQHGTYAVEQLVHDGPREDFAPLKDVSGAEGKWNSRITLEIVPPGGNSSETADNLGPADDGSPDSICFYPDGTADAAEIRLRDRDGFQVRLQLNPVTAQVHLTTPQHE